MVRRWIRWGLLNNKLRRIRKWSWPKLSNYPDTCLQVLRKTRNRLSEGSQCPRWDFNSRPPEYQGISATQKKRSAQHVVMHYQHTRWSSNSPVIKCTKYKEVCLSLYNAWGNWTGGVTCSCCSGTQYSWTTPFAIGRQIPLAPTDSTHNWAAWFSRTLKILVILTRTQLRSTCVM